MCNSGRFTNGDDIFTEQMAHMVNEVGKVLQNVFREDTECKWLMLIAVDTSLLSYIHLSSLNRIDTLE